jgi:peptidyl-prolyl cis-trans isomerase C
MFSRQLILLVYLLLLVASLAACSATVATTAPAPSPANTSAPTIMPTTAESPTPTATTEPLALRVNGEGVSLAEFQAEMAQLQDALTTQGRELSEAERRQQVTDVLVDSLLLAQGALEAGFSLDDAALQTEIDRLTGQAGGEAALRDWQVRNGYSEAAFRAALRRAMTAAWQRDQIAALIPLEAEQVHARQILALDEDSAQRALQRIQVPGTNFATVAFMYDSQIGGDLGWFPRGYLAQPEVETAAFALKPGEISAVIRSQVGYHILQVIAREVRPLSPDARRALQRAAISAWLVQRRGASTIETIN